MIVRVARPSVGIQIGGGATGYVMGGGEPAQCSMHWTIITIFPFPAFILTEYIYIKSILLDVSIYGCR